MSRNERRPPPVLNSHDFGTASLLLGATVAESRAKHDNATPPPRPQVGQEGLACGQFKRKQKGPGSVITEEK